MNTADCSVPSSQPSMCESLRARHLPWWLGAAVAFSTVVAVADARADRHETQSASKAANADGTIRSRLLCSPSRLSRSGVLTLRFASPHAAELAVVRPDRNFFFIAQRRLPGSQMATGMPSEVFAGVVELKIQPGAFTATKWHVNAKEPEPVFTTPGKYRFVLADRIESEDPEAQHCDVLITD